MKPQIILITGASSGLGLSLVQTLGNDHIVYATSRNLDKLKQLIEEYHLNCHPIVLDVLDENQIALAFEKIKNEKGRLDVLINNAAQMELGFFEDMGLKSFNRQIEINFLSVVSITKTFLGLLKESSCARIINISSASGLMAMPALSSYGASKWALEGFSESLRLELKGQVDVVVVESGPMKTSMITSHMKVHKDSKSKYFKQIELFEKKLKSYPPKLLVDPKKIATKISKLILRKSSKFRILFSISSRLKLYLKRLVPFSLYEKIILACLKK